MKILCDTCSHNKVCKYVESYLDVSDKTTDLNKVTPDIFVVSVVCAKYASNETIRTDNLW